MKDINQYSLWTAIVTPMNEDSSINFEDFKNILKEQEKANNAIVVLGSTGEALNLNQDTAKKVLEYALSLNLDVPVMTGINGFNLSATLEYIEYLNSLKGLDAYLVVTPHYAKPGEDGQYQWFKAILDKANKPCMLYNVPGRTAVKLNFNTVKRLKDHKNFWSIKEASGSVEDFKMYRDAVGDKNIYSGDDGMIYDFHPFKISGLVSVASNAWPLETNLYVKKCLSNQLTSEDDVIWKKASDSLFLVSNPVPVKRLMSINKQISTPNLQLPLSHLDLKSTNELISAHESIKAWYKGEL